MRSRPLSRREDETKSYQAMNKQHRDHQNRVEQS
jgi:hypothetical protein